MENRDNSHWTRTGNRVEQVAGTNLGSQLVLPLERKDRSGLLCEGFAP